MSLIFVFLVPTIHSKKKRVLFIQRTKSRPWPIEASSGKTGLRLIISVKQTEHNYPCVAGVCCPCSPTLRFFKPVWWCLSAILERNTAGKEAVELCEDDFRNAMFVSEHPGGMDNRVEETMARGKMCQYSASKSKLLRSPSSITGGEI